MEAELASPKFCGDPPSRHGFFDKSVNSGGHFRRMARSGRYVRLLEHWFDVLAPTPGPNFEFFVCWRFDDADTLACHSLLAGPSSGLAGENRSTGPPSLILFSTESVDDGP